MVLFVSSKPRRLEERTFAVLEFLFHLQHMKRPAFQVTVLRMEMSSGLSRDGPQVFNRKNNCLHTSDVKCIPTIIVPTMQKLENVRNWLKALKQMLQIK